MGKILPKPDGVKVLLEPAELLDKVFISTSKPEASLPRRYFVTDVIRTVAWQMLWQHARSMIEKRNFSYGDVDYEEGK